MWVNGEKYIFSEHVIQKGLELYSQFLLLVKTIQGIHLDCSDEFDYDAIEMANANTPGNIKTLRSQLLKFDLMWLAYEKDYIGELMVIEVDARRFITESIKIDKALSLFELNGEDF